MRHRRSVLLGLPHLLSLMAMVAVLTITSPAVLGIFLVALQVACLVMNVVAARVAGDPRAARPWWLLAIGFSLLMASTACFVAAGLGSVDYTDADPGWLLAAILARFAFVLVFLAALLSLSDRTVSSGGRWRLVMDATTVLGGGLMVTWYFILGPVLDGARGRVVALGWELAIIPLAELALVMGVCTLLLRGSSPAGRRPLLLLLVAAVTWFVSDFVTSATGLHPGVELPIMLSGALQTGPLVFTLAAATEQCRLHLDGDTRLVARRLRPVSGLPDAALVAGFALLALAAARGSIYPWTGLIGGAALMTFSVAARQSTVLNENRSLATTDALTGLANRIRLHEVLDDLDARHLPARRPCAVMMFDLDDFKPVNDTLGHEAGDALLVHFAQVLRDNVRGSDTAARLGGDEFAVVLLDIDDADHAIRVAERILHELETPIEIGDKKVNVRTSVGISVPAGGDTRGDVLMREADLAMYEAKRDRGSGWQLFAPGRVDPRLEHARRREELRLAVDAGQMCAVYQPIVSLAGRDIIGVEALVRWNHPSRGLLGPATFLPLAEKTGIVHDIDFWVLRESCRVVRTWQDQMSAGRRFQLNANLSAGQLARPNLASLVLEVLAETGFDPRDLVLEITETSVLAVEDAPAHCTALREQGVRIALDDFGTGHSSLEHLLRMPVDMLKLDGCFVADLATERASLAIAEAVVQLSHVLRLATVAEGIETEEQASQMLSLGYDSGQGYHFCRPQAAEAMPAMLGIRAAAHAPQAVVLGAGAGE